MRTAKLLVLAAAVGAAVLVAVSALPGDAQAGGQADAPSPAVPGCRFPLPNPSEIGIARFQPLLVDFMANGCYETLGWTKDEGIRTTGPYIDNADGTVESYGTHGSGGVRICYSPGVMSWLRADRQGEIADGEMILKAMYPRRKDDPSQFDTSSPGWAIMVKDAAGSWDGWYWSDGAPLQVSYTSQGADGGEQVRYYPSSGFGQYCLNCHASADNPEATYSALRNVDGTPLTYLTVIQTMGTFDPHGAADAADDDDEVPIHERAQLPPAPRALARPLAASAMPPWVPAAPAAITPQPMPITSYDNVPQGPRPGGQKQFVTSDQCMGCHDATQSNSALPNMVLPVEDPRTGEVQNLDLAPFGEWRYSLMGLSGRDPVFFSQLDSERAKHPELADVIDNKCLSCHGVMGQRQYVHDRGPQALFTHDMVRATPEWTLPPEQPYRPELARYGALARDGVSCAVCHRIEADGLGTFETYTGLFKVSEEATKIYGPYEDVATKPMDHALGLTPEYAPQLRESKMCGSCHTVFVPQLDVDRSYTRAEFDAIAHASPEGNYHEQVTYFEWRNSVFTTESATPGPEAQSCQSCHMPPDWDGETLRYRVANIEDDTFPDVDNRLPAEEIHLRVRGDDADEPFSRHALHGINLFVNSMFDQFGASILGVSSYDYMGYNLAPGSKVALAEGIRFAQQETATIEVLNLARSAGGLAADVRVRNLAGHKFPSGVGFRRAFIDFQVADAAGKVLWRSGGTDSWGVIGTGEGAAFRPLPTEFLEGGAYQQHHQVITSQQQVQIYEELVKDNLGQFTTSFLALSQPVKDNRLMPKGWRLDGPDARWTHPEGAAAHDPSYLDGSATDTVRYQVPLPAGAGPLTVTATLYYQSIPPYYLRDRFEHLDQQATRNLLYLVSHLQLDGPLADWKLLVQQAQATLR